MPNNENNNENQNNNFAMPNLNNNQNELPKAETPEKPIIEIPKEYYEKIAAEKVEKEQAEKKAAEDLANRKEVGHFFGHLITLIIFNSVIIFGLIYSYLKYNEKLIFAIPAYIIVMAIFEAIKSKKDNVQPLAIMIGGMAVAVITFLLSAVDPKQVDLWSYYAIASAICAFVGLIVSSIINKIIGDRQNVKALQSVGMIIFLIILIAVPCYFYSKYPDKIYNIIFMKKPEVKAETEDEFIIKTLNKRYDTNFVCDPQSIMSNVDQLNRKIDQRLCYEEDLIKSKNLNESLLHENEKALENNRIIVTSIAYHESDNQYIVQDDYMDLVLLRKFKTDLEERLTEVLSVNKVLVYLYPKENCSFIGNCADNKDYYDSYEKETDPDNQYKSSSSLDFSKYLTMDAKDFVNEYQFKYIITLTSGTFATEDTYQPAIDRVLSELDSLGLKNTYGYVINLYNLPPENPFPTKVHEIEGKASANHKFIG